MTPPLVITLDQQRAMAERLDRAFLDRMKAAFPDEEDGAVEARIEGARALGFAHEADIAAFLALHSEIHDPPDDPPDGAELAREILNRRDLPPEDRIAAARDALGHVQT